jgi:hypothetical protein
MGNSVFFEQIKLFWIPGRFTPPGNILEWLFIVWVLYIWVLNRVKCYGLTWRDLFGPPLVFPEEIILIGLVGLWIFNFILSLYNVIDFIGVFRNGIQLGCMYVGYLLMRGIINNAANKDIDNFLHIIVLINAIAGILYILNQGLHLPVYVGSQNEQVLMGLVISRTFLWMPRFYYLSIAYVFSRSKWSISDFGIFVITILSAFFSYTRSIFIVFGLLMALTIILRIDKDNLIGSISRAAFVFLSGAIIYWAITRIFPTEVLYFSDRFQGLNIYSFYSGSNNFTMRLDFFRRTYEIVRQQNILTGLGMATQSTYSAIYNFEKWSADMTWIAVLFRYGLIGIFLFAMLFFMLGIRTLRELFLAATRRENEYWLMFFLLIVGTFGESFISWTIFDMRNYSLALWFLVFIVIKIGKKRYGSEILKS